MKEKLKISERITFAKFKKIKKFIFKYNNRIKYMICGVPHNTSFNGYVIIPLNHPLANQCYRDVSEDIDYKVHNGLTYGDYYKIDDVKYFMYGFDNSGTYDLKLMGNYKNGKIVYKVNDLFGYPRKAWSFEDVKKESEKLAASFERYWKRKEMELNY